VVQPTSEEVVTDIARQEIKSYKQLPKNFYQIQTKFRDERRPRFGLMRGREFIMKDAYSFDRDQVSAKASYQVMAQTYRKIFDRFGLRYRAVAADSGAIGGDLSEEFQVIAATGEDAIVYCPGSDYAANMEKAEALWHRSPGPGQRQAAMDKIAPRAKAPAKTWPNCWGLPLQPPSNLWCWPPMPRTTRQRHQTQVWLLLLRGDHDMNEVKVGKVPGLAEFRFATVDEIEEHFGCKPGYLGPLNLVADSKSKPA
jgi:prolyl-tRNA synthetase